MFTGLIEEVGIIRRVERAPEGARLVIGARKVLEGTKVGDSIAVSGACLTVTALGRDELVADCISETLSRTTLGKANTGIEVNLERSLALGDRLGGHLVLGHVDGVAQVLGLQPKGVALEVSLSLPVGVATFVAEKGSVALDGVSLTVIKVDAGEFVVGLIPHTMGVTTLRYLAKGTSVNLEADVLARYVHRSLQASLTTEGAVPEAPGGLSIEMLRVKGFA